MARLLWRDERVHAQGMEVANRLLRVVTSVGGYFLWYCALVLRLGTAPVLLMASAIMTTACCLSEDWLVARAATITW